MKAGRVPHIAPPSQGAARTCPFAQTHIAELANGSIGYIPNRSACQEGNYEVESARCAAGSGEMLVQAAIKMLEELKAKAMSPK